MPNRLAQETSPYLQQHADNPVDWHPWGAKALALAREQNKPICSLSAILLVIGATSWRTSRSRTRTQQRS